jgi:tetratricopeptide (TPR) repeat protein
MKNKYVYPIIIFLIVASCAAFGRVMGNDFNNFDDNAFITENIHIQSGFNTESIKWAFTTIYLSYWHPFTWLSYMLDWKLFGANASGHHLVSLLLHIGSVILLFLFLNKSTKNLWSSAFTAAFFALHPLRVESVAWAAERKDVLSMFFGMASIYTYFAYTENHRLSKYFLCLILFILSLMSKPMMLTLPFVLLLLDYWPFARWQQAMSLPSETRSCSAGKLIWEKIPFFLLTIIFSIVTYWAQNKLGSVNSLEIIPVSQRIYNAIVSYATYLGKTFWPVNLAVYYPYDLSFNFLQVLISGVVLIVMTVFVLYYIRKAPVLFTGWFIYLGTLIPVIGLVQTGSQAMADRYTYLPSLGIALMLSWGISLLLPNETMRKKILIPTATAILIALSVITWYQCGYWKNSVTLFNHALKVTKSNTLAHNNLGLALFMEGKIQEAIYHYNKAVDTSPVKINHILAYNNRGIAYNKLGQYPKALEDYTQAIYLHPNHFLAYFNRGIIYYKIGQYQLAIDDFNDTIRLNPCYISFYFRGMNLAKLGQQQMALEDFNKAVSLKPDFADAYKSMAFIYFSQGNSFAGCENARKACALGNCTALKTSRVKGLCR